MGQRWIEFTESLRPQKKFKLVDRPYLVRVRRGRGPNPRWAEARVVATRYGQVIVKWFSPEYDAEVGGVAEVSTVDLYDVQSVNALESLGDALQDIEEI